MIIDAFISIYIFIMSVSNTLSLSDALNLDNSAVARGKSLEAGSRRHGLGKELDVDLVHGGKVLHVGEVHIVLDDLLQG